MTTAENLPVRKVMSGGLAGAVVTVLLVVAGKINPALATWPDGFESALTTIVSFAAAYLTAPAASEAVLVNAAGTARSGTTVPAPDAA